MNARTLPPTQTFAARRSRWGRLVRRAGVCGLVVASAACGDDGPTGGDQQVVCDLDPALLSGNVPPDWIPALTETPMVSPDEAGADYLLDSDRVLGVYMNGEARAYPHNILWHHEIVNDRIGSDWVSVTFCPLTGSGVGFDPVLGTRLLDVGVSGLLYANNLVLYDRATEDIYGPQLGVVGACGDFQGQSLELAPVQEMSWGRWKELHPTTTVVSSDTRFGWDYTVYPYGSYDEITSDELWVEMSVDRSRPIKERVLAVRDGSGGRGYPFGELRQVGFAVALNEIVGGIPTAIFFESGDGEAALAYDARVGGQTLTFDANGAGVWTDRETGSTWSFDGAATSGQLAGERLAVREDAYTLFWFAWRHFQPDATMFDAP